MFDRFTDRARKVMGLARKEAQRYHHDFIGTEHLLLGLIQEGSGVAASVLQKWGVGISQLRSEIENNVPPGPSMVTRGQLPFTPRAKRVLELSMEEADELGHGYIGTEHLLLGLLRENEGIAVRVLLDLGLEMAIEEWRDEVLGLLGTEESLQRLGRFESQLGRQAAHRLCHGFVGTGHVLLGLLEEEGGLARRILEGLGVTAGRLQAEKDRIARYDLAGLSQKQIPILPPARKAMEHAFRLGEGLQVSGSGSEHLLLALLSERENAVTRLLGDLGVPVEEAQKRVCDVLGIAPEEAERALAEQKPEGAIRKFFRRHLRRRGEH